MAALFHPSGGLFIPDDLTRSPWGPDSLHGGPVSALLAREIEAVPAGSEMQVTRLTVDLIRPVPMRPLRVSARLERPGRRVQIVVASLHDGDTLVASATALRIRIRPVLLPPLPEPPSPPSSPNGPPAPAPWDFGYVAYHRDAVDLINARGSMGEPGPAAVWTRLRQPIVPGEDPTPLQRVAAAADFGNGVSATLDGAVFLFMNPDVTTHLARYPEGEWICIESSVQAEALGVGLVSTTLYDSRGRIGAAHQSQVLEAR